MTAGRRAIGLSGEAAAAAWYVARGYRVIARNWRCRVGELDIVAIGPTVLVFVEVRTRSSTRFGTPGESITAAKIERLRSLALAFLAAHPRLRPGPRGHIRFDVAAVTVGADGRPTVEVIERAF